MITEIAHITIDPARADAFEAAVAAAAPLFKASRGCHSMALERGVEDPTSYRLLIEWETIEDHMQTFRNSLAFVEWRALAGPFFVTAPTVIHTMQTARYF